MFALAALTVEVKYLCTPFFYLKRTFSHHIVKRSVTSHIVPYLTMDKFTTAQRVEILFDFWRSHKCISDTLNTLKSRGIRAKKNDIFNLVECLRSTGGVRDCDIQVYNKRKGNKGSKDALNSVETKPLPNHSETSINSRIFTEDEGYVVVYTDGACENNGKPNAKAGIGVWFGDNHPLNVSQAVQGRATNNTAEIQACVRALEILHQEGVQKIRLKTDSQFTISCATQWIKKWKKNNWKLANGGNVKNKKDLIMLNNILEKIIEVEWVHIAGHKGERGNEEADKLARNGALLYKK